ncbi:MAG: hypothetical protein F4057_10935, partial [Acidobacteria bacterium]|nr:hypothetical protein [Acidobacteriota bacterium]
MRKSQIRVATALLLAACAAPSAAGAGGQQAAADEAASAQALLDRYCVTCHNARLRTADLA